MPTKNQYDRNSQTANAMPLVLGLVPEDQRAAVLDGLVAQIRAGRNRVTSGDVGFNYHMRALSDAGQGNVLYDMLISDDGPGYAYQLRKGATSLIETWDTSPAQSQNHCMLGHSDEHTHMVNAQRAIANLEETGVAQTGMAEGKFECWMLDEEISPHGAQLSTSSFRISCLGFHAFFPAAVHLTARSFERLANLRKFAMIPIEPTAIPPFVPRIGNGQPPPKTAKLTAFNHASPAKIRPLTSSPLSFQHFSVCSHPPSVAMNPSPCHPRIRSADRSVGAAPNGQGARGQGPGVPVRSATSAGFRRSPDWHRRIPAQPQTGRDKRPRWSVTTMRTKHLMRDPFSALQHSPCGLTSGRPGPDPPYPLPIITIRISIRK